MKKVYKRADKKDFETLDEFAREVKQQDNRAAENDFKDAEDVKQKHNWFLG